MMTDDEIQLKAQSSLQEYDDAVENLAPNYAELGQKCVAALDEFIGYWKGRPESRESDPGGEHAESDMREFIERQLAWAEHEKKRVLDQLAKPGAGRRGQ